MLNVSEQIVSSTGYVQRFELTSEVIGLTLHGTKATHLPHELSFCQSPGSQSTFTTYPADCLPVLL